MSAYIEIARANAGIISVVGALIVFFSWIVSNTLKTNHENLKQAITSAERDSRTYGAIAELQGQVHSIASEIVQPKLLERISAEGGSNAQAKYSRSQSEFSRTLLAAQQIRECNEFCARSLTLSNAHSAETDPVKQLKEAAIEAANVFRDFSDDRKRCEDAMFQVVSAPSDQRDAAYMSATEVLESFIDNTRLEYIPKVKPLYEKAVPATNARTDELSNLKTRSAKWATWFGSVALWLYIFGSTLLLFGQYLDKTKPPPNKAVNPSGGSVVS